MILSSFSLKFRHLSTSVVAEMENKHKQIKKMEISQHTKYFSEFYGKYAVKRKAVGIWGCKDCGKVKAGGAYTSA
ncbi:hypothetical protein MKW98_031877 [Papaver atlanticum]|uniref:60S ribosomal protein L37a n=1 Tax=Papaver atlanticum TaxID=357466 RepID=A0AAD4SDU0_9MAGN|nr:hypothetical protein MKW98_031877 [Papaver atlanticum]